MRGFVLVISSDGEAYSQMEDAWLLSWRRQLPDGLGLLMLSSGPFDRFRPLDAPAAWRLETTGATGLVPGVLRKTLAGLAWVRTRHPDAWVFRTNLSSYVELSVLAGTMDGLAGAVGLGYSPTFDHLSGSGMGLTREAVDLVLGHAHELDTGLIDDVALSQLLKARGCATCWTGRLDRVWPDGTNKLGRGPWYHVRVKTLDRLEDARVLRALAATGIGPALSWFSGSPTGSPPASASSRPG